METGILEEMDVGLGELLEVLMVELVAFLGNEEGAKKVLSSVLAGLLWYESTSGPKSWH